MKNNNSILAFDLGGTKLASAWFDLEGNTFLNEKTVISENGGDEVGQLIKAKAAKFISEPPFGKKIAGIGICIPGIYNISQGTVWAPNIRGWENYPLLEELQSISRDIPVHIASDRTCYILGEWWKGKAKGCTDAIYVAIGTGIGAGILAGGEIVHGANDIAGAVGWMALQRPFSFQYQQHGCFETYASGEGIPRLAKHILSSTTNYNGELKNKEVITAADVFEAFEKKDIIACKVLEHCIEVWGMAIANLVSLLNPQKIILGGGVFGPAVKFIPDIVKEASKWAQPVSMKKVVVEASALGGQTGLYGAACLVIRNLKTNRIA